MTFKIKMGFAFTLPEAISLSLPSLKIDAILSRQRKTGKAWNHTELQLP